MKEKIHSILCFSIQTLQKNLSQEKKKRILLFKLAFFSHKYWVPPKIENNYCCYLTDFFLRISRSRCWFLNIYSEDLRSHNWFIFWIIFTVQIFLKILSLSYLCALNKCLMGILLISLTSWCQAFFSWWTRGLFWGSASQVI